jgi:hypothetical protein
MKIWFSNIDWKREFEYLDMNKTLKKFCSIIEMAVQKVVLIGYVKS